MKCLNLYQKSKQGFNLIEVIIVIAIFAALMASLGLPAYFSQRNDLQIEQAGEELAADIRLLKSKVLAVQQVGSGASAFIPKAAFIYLQAGTSTAQIHYIRRSGASCVDSLAVTENLPFMQKADVKSINSGANLYLTYTAPAARFSAYSSSPSFTYRAEDGACVPSGSNILIPTINVTITNGAKDYYLDIDSVNGTVTPRR